MTDRTGYDALPLAASAWVFLSLAGVACGMTFLFLGMRAVMEIGGACADGVSPYAIVRPCPRGAPAALVGGFWAGVVCLGIYLYQTTTRGIPNLVALAWPALFISLGWSIVSALERLAALHASGALGDEEYRAAKARVLDRGAPR